MIFTSLLVACVIALTGVFQAQMPETLLLSLTLLTMPTLSAVSNVFYITGPMPLPTLPAVLEPFSDLLVHIAVPFSRSAHTATLLGVSQTSSGPTAGKFFLSAYASYTILAFVLWSLVFIASAILLCIIYQTSKSSIISVSPSTFASITFLLDDILDMTSVASDFTSTFGPFESLSDFASVSAGDIFYLVPPPASTSFSAATSASMDDSFFCDVCSPISDSTPTIRPGNHDSLIHLPSCPSLDSEHVVAAVYPGNDEWSWAYRDDG